MGNAFPVATFRNMVINCVQHILLMHGLHHDASNYNAVSKYATFDDDDNDDDSLEQAVVQQEG